MSATEIQKFYAGKTLFLTGGTGFVGLALLEKILRVLPDVEKVYMLMRPKKGKEIADRLQDIAKNSIFEKLLETATPDIFTKLVPVAGDVGEPNLGLSAADRQRLIDEVELVVHSAATLDFQLSLRPTVTINLLGTRRLLELCGEMRKLKAVVHVSSAYVNAFLTDVDEKVYAAQEDADKVIELINTLTDAQLQEMEAKLLGSHPNAYTFTKHLAEHEVVKYSERFPCTIVRPTMITAAWKEPVPGWTNSKVGPQGFLMGASKGVVRRLPIARDSIADYIPIDVVVNELLVAGYHAATSKSALTVYHCSSSTTKPFTWGLIEGQLNDILHKYPLKSAIWYPHLKFVSSVWMFKFSAIFVHFLPAIFLDMILRITGQRPILFRLHKNIWSSLDRLHKFIFNEWRFHNPNTRDLEKSLSDGDREKFYLDVSSIDWVEYCINLHRGVRRYLNNEKDKTLEAARGKNTLLLVLHMLLQLSIVGLGWYFSSCILGLTMRQCAWAAPLTYMLFSLL